MCLTVLSAGLPAKQVQGHRQIQNCKNMAHTHPTCLFCVCSQRKFEVNAVGGSTELDVSANFLGGKKSLRASARAAAHVSGNVKVYFVFL